MLRTLFEHMSRRVVLRRRMPSRFGGDPILVSPDASLRFWRWNMEKVDPGLFDWAASFVSEGDVVWDVGARAFLRRVVTCRFALSLAVPL